MNSTKLAQLFGSNAKLNQIATTVAYAVEAHTRYHQQMWGQRTDKDTTGWEETFAKFAAERKKNRTYDENIFPVLADTLRDGSVQDRIKARLITLEASRTGFFSNPQNAELTMLIDAATSTKSVAPTPGQI